MPLIWHVLFKKHLYTSMLLATTLEGLGLPVPAELLFLAAAVLVAQGHASLPGVILAAIIGNTLGAMVGFTLAYVGGRGLIARVSSLVGIKAESLGRVEEFFGRYGALTVFLSRFIGFIRAAAIYSAGAARMAPWRFALYVLTAATVWNTGWAVLAFKFGPLLPGLLHRVLAHGVVWGVSLMVIILVGRLVFRWFRSRRTV